MILFRRFKGMIRPGMGLTLGGSRKIADRKTVPFVMYLRARRGIVDLTLPEWMRKQAARDKVAMRKAHFRLRARSAP